MEVAMVDTLTVGQVSSASGVHVETIRYYQGLGIVRAPKRPGAGFRRYGQADVARLRFIKRAQQLGFTLDEVIDALRAHDAGGATCDSERWRLEAVVDRIDARIAGLRRARRNTMKILEECRAGRCQFASPSC